MIFEDFFAKSKKMDHLKGIKVIWAFVLLRRCSWRFRFRLENHWGFPPWKKITKLRLLTRLLPSGRSLYSAKLIRSRMTGRKSGSEVGVGWPRPTSLWIDDFFRYTLENDHGTQKRMFGRLLSVSIGWFVGSTWIFRGVRPTWSRNESPINVAVSTTPR